VIKRNDLKKILTGKYLPVLDIEVHPSNGGMQFGTKFNFKDNR